MARQSARRAHASTESNTASTVVSSTKADDSQAKPAPAPIYADAGVAAARNTQKVSDAVRAKRNLVMNSLTTVGGPHAGGNSQRRTQAWR
jgi:hypothetical protein